jgi:hypothetical protein
MVRHLHSHAIPGVSAGDDRKCTWRSGDWDLDSGVSFNRLGAQIRTLLRPPASDRSILTCASSDFGICGFNLITFDRSGVGRQKRLYPKTIPQPHKTYYIRLRPLYKCSIKIVFLVTILMMPKINGFGRVRLRVVEYDLKHVLTRTFFSRSPWSNLFCIPMPSKLNRRQFEIQQSRSGRDSALANDECWGQLSDWQDKYASG